MTTQPMEAPSPSVDESAAAICARVFKTIAHGALSDFEAVIHTEAMNREASNQPPAARQRGPKAFYATAL